MNVRYSSAFKTTIKAEGITQAEVIEAMHVIEEDAAGRPHPLYLNKDCEAIRDTGLIWYRLKPKHAQYRIVYSVQRAEKTITVEGIFRRNARTYTRIMHLFKATPEPNQP